MQDCRGIVISLTFAVAASVSALGLIMARSPSVTCLVLGSRYQEGAI